jgi:hypothetical protein
MNIVWPSIDWSIAKKKQHLILMFAMECYTSINTLKEFANSSYI